MKSILYKNPIISTIAIDILTMIIYIFLLNEGLTGLYITILIPGNIVGRIMKNGYNLNSKKKLFILLSFVISICIITLYGFYITQARLKQNIGN